MNPEKIFRFLLTVVLLTAAVDAFSQIRLNTPNTESILYAGKGKKMPLVVALGGSEGGNAWASNYWKSTRDRFLEKGYAILAIGYFGAEGTPDTLNRIAIEDVYNAVKKACSNKRINKKRIAVIGGSRGADLALLLGSYYKEITCAVGLVASNAVFPGHTSHFSSSCWTYKNQELPFVPVNEAAVPFLMSRNLRGAFEAMLKDSAAAEKAAIKVEQINGPILLLSAAGDEICPSAPMAEKMIERLKSNRFRHYYEHHSFEGGHSEPLKHFDLVFDFLEKHFRNK